MLLVEDSSSSSKVKKLYHKVKSFNAFWPADCFLHNKLFIIVVVSAVPRAKSSAAHADCQRVHLRVDPGVVQRIWLAISLGGAGDPQYSCSIPVWEVAHSSSRHRLI